jgi:hypothetical protein
MTNAHVPAMASHFLSGSRRNYYTWRSLPNPGILKNGQVYFYLESAGISPANAWGTKTIFTINKV